MASVCFRIAGPEREWDRLVGELFSSGCLGVEEAEDELVGYFADTVNPTEILALSDSFLGIEVSGPSAVAERDWSRDWRSGLAPRLIAGLWLRPSWCESQGEPELVLDPRQAFGTGEHATTRLCLGQLAEVLCPGDSLLDVGTGTGILALAGRHWGARTAIGLDVDPVAAFEAASNAMRNGMRLRLFAGTLEALADHAHFDVVVVNMLSSRMVPLLDGITQRTRRRLILSGYLQSETPRIESELIARGLRRESEGCEVQSGESWVVSCWAHEVAR